MNFIESFRMAISSILAHKLRSTLTMIGIIIGVGSVIGIVAIGKGGEEILKSNFVSSDGQNKIKVMFTPEEESYVEGENPSYFSEEDIKNLDEIPEIESVHAMNSISGSVSLNKNKEVSQIQGIDDGYVNQEDVSITEGRFIHRSEFRNNVKVAVITKVLADKLKKQYKTTVLNSYLDINGNPFKIVGIYKTGSTEVNQVMIPLSVWPELNGDSSIKSLTLVAKNLDKLEIAGNKATDLLNKTKPSSLKGEYSVINFKTIQEAISTITGVMTYLVGGIASISLVVGGIGVMNIMYVSVTERTQEIGLRKALGATKTKILTQFLIESMMLTVMGGMIGIVVGIGIANIVSYLADWPPIVPVYVIIGGVLFSMFIGILFGLLPANRAAKLKPIESLRYE
ncbi:MAG: ABC transporter permease [Anaerobacillus sp.]